MRLREIESRTPDAERFEIEDVVAVGSHLVLKVKYPNCERCSYEGTKIMVFLNCSTIDALDTPGGGGQAVGLMREASQSRASCREGNWG